MKFCTGICSGSGLVTHCITKNVQEDLNSENKRWFNFQVSLTLTTLPQRRRVPVVFIIVT